MDTKSIPEKNPLISIIIPVYNVESHITKTLSLLQKQTFGSFEIIVVNDGSTDNSLSQIQKISKNEYRIKIISQENKGPGEARNRGILASKGEYIAFLDSDDYFDNNFLSIMYEKAIKENAEIVVCDFQKVTVNGKIIKEYKHNYINTINSLEAFVDIMQSINLTSISQNKLFRKNLFKTVKYPAGIIVNEDVATIYRLILKAERIAFVNQFLFYYVQVDGSSMHSFSSKKLDDRFKVAQLIKNHLTQETLLPKYHFAYNNYYLLNVVLSGALQICKYSDNWKSNLKDFLNRVDNSIFSYKNIFPLNSYHFKKMIALLTLKTNISLFNYLLKFNK